MELKDKKVLVVGMGRSGKAAVIETLKKGAEVFVQDSKSADEIDEQLRGFLEENCSGCIFGKTPDEDEKFDMLILSPGVPPTLDFIQKAKSAGAEIIGELELAYRLSKGRFVAITGTNGKTTTTTLVGEIYKAAGFTTHVGGNIGVAITSEAAEACEEDVLVTETSSFQLETISRFRPAVSAILNLTPDHLNRHGDMINYGKAKAAIFRNQTEEDFCIMNYDDKASWELIEREGCRACVVPFSRVEKLDFGAFVKDGMIIIKRQDGEEISICGTEELKIPGSHNLENALAAAAISFFGGVEPNVIGEVLRQFAGVEHRIEMCGEVNGVRFVNDSKGTNTDAASKAIEAMKENIILIAGGYDKGSEFEQFAKEFIGPVKGLVLMGKTAEKIKDAAEKAGFTNITMCSNMEECVLKAYEQAEKGDVVLLSPACASWDMYNSFEERGDHFRKCVQKLH